ncbi:MAG: thioredoxin domain-containing protein, partial [Frankiaceae bacterium]
MANRLTSSTSPYLLQHKDNPVDWWPWCGEAFEAARSRGVPVLLSVGYAACHWCHVMAHESFEDAGIAAQLNAGFVSVKVDREERPDVDAVYMEVTQAMTGSGGWPMTCFLTPEGNPFFCGTYFPRVQFSQLLTRVSEVWAQRRADVQAQGRDIVRQLEAFSARPAPGGITPALLDAAAAGLAAGFDAERGGFGTAPKFPPSMVLEFLLRHAARTGESVWTELVVRTCERMARGGIYDQLAGGFARYSVDAGWVVPHFEKMLYDNAQLLRVYTHLWRATGDPLARRVARETAEFLLRDLRTGEGGFASALDADAAGGEGTTYVWTPRQLRDALGAADGVWAAAQFAVSLDGTFEHGTSVLQRLDEPDDSDRYEQIRGRLKKARDQRPQPARDDKVVAAWNGLAIAALAEAGALF